MSKAMLTAFIVTAMCGLMACTAARTQPEPASDLEGIQRRLTASEERVEQLSQELARVQALVDSHQLGLPNQEKAGAASPDAQPLSIPEAAAATVPVSTDPAPVETASGAPSGLAQSPSPPQPSPASQSSLAEPPAAPQAITSSPIEAPNPAYQEAMDIFRTGDYESAAERFETFVEAYPKDDLADNALYWAGECRYTKKKFTEAIHLFKRVVNEYPSGSKVPDALLKIAYAYISLGDKASAETYLKQVIAQYPFSSAGAKAEERLDTLR